MNEKLKTGLRPLPSDHRDFSLGAIIPIKDFPKLEELPNEFILETSEVKDQLDDHCTGNTTALLIGINEGMSIEETWMFAKSKELSGDPDSWGQDLRTAFRVGVKFGALPKDKSPFTSEKGNEFLRKIENWPPLDFYASSQKQKTFWKVSGRYDSFDNIRATIWYLNNRKQRQGVGMGLVWGYLINQYILSEIKEQGEGHAIACIGWQNLGNKSYLVLQNSWGKKAGKNGRHLISREVVNHWAERYGTFVYMDIPKEKAEYMQENNLKIGDNWMVQIAKVFWSFARGFCPDRTFGASRSPEWNKIRKENLKSLCELCEKKKGFLQPLEVHHIQPFHLKPDLELNPENLITLCRSCHLYFAHLGNFKSYNADIKKDALAWSEKRKRRP